MSCASFYIIGYPVMDYADFDPFLKVDPFIFCN